MDNRKSSHVNKGILIALIFVVLDLIAGFANLKMEPWYRWLNFVLMVVSFIIVCIMYSNERNNEVTFGNIFGYGFRVSLVIAVIFVIYTILSLYLIFPDQKEQMIQEQMQELEKQNLSDDQKDAALAMFSKLFVPIAFIAAVLGPIIVGVIGSLLGAAFAKKRPITSFDNQSI